MFEFRVSIPFVPRWQHVELLRTAVLNCLTTIFQAHDFCEQLAMVTAELLENAIHYGRKRGNTEIGFWLEVLGDPDSITIDVQNPSTADADNVRRLQGVISELEQSDPRTAYTKRLQRIAGDPDALGSGLGLFRIAYETGCELSTHMSEDGILRVRAVVRASEGWPRHPHQAAG